jgi:hypothetical protein
MKILAGLMCLTAVWAATPLTGTWKLNRAKSTVEGALPSFIHNGTMSIRAGGIGAPAVPPASFVAVDGNDDKKLYRVDISPDQRTLTIIRVQSYENQSGQPFHTVLVLEKQ